jgi:tripartite-type tricarboxylate transporter receptor subunit TctC
MVLAIFASLWTSLAAAAGEENYPTRKITYLLVFDPGGQSDIEARRQQPHLEKLLGQKIVIDYKVGGGGTVGWAEMVRGKPDGYQITGINTPPIISQPLAQNVGYKTEQILPIVLFHRTPLTFAVSKKSPYNSIKDYIEAARKNPGKVTIGGTGTNSGSHLTAVRFRKLAGVEIEYVPFTGNAPLMTALMGGHVDAVVGVSNDMVRFANEVRTLAIATENRFFALPEVPTLKEQGIDLEEATYRGVAVPTGTPEPIVRKLEKVFLEICKMSEVSEGQKKEGFEPTAIGVDESKAIIAKMIPIYRQVLTDLKKK